VLIFIVPPGRRHAGGSLQNSAAEIVEPNKKIWDKMPIAPRILPKKSICMSENGWISPRGMLSLGMGVK
jgi:hypothetical protein